MEEMRNNEETKSIEIDEPVSFVEQQESSVSNYANETKGSSDLGKRRRFMPYIATGVISAMVGGMIMAAAAMYFLPKTQMFKDAGAGSPLAQQVNSNNSGSSDPKLVSSVTGSMSVVEIAKKVGPAVVGITATTDGPSDPFGFSSGQQVSQGSGIIFSQDGYIVTNYHVVQGAQTVKIDFIDGKEVNGKVVNYDAVNDLAVVKITDSGVKVPGVAEFGDSDKLEVGEPAVAIGNPLGKDLLGTVTAGVISAVNRKIDIEGEGSPNIYIQTDAAINPGNSGGPLLNEFGQVVGINTAKASGEGLGFAIPINLVKPKIEQLTKPLLVLGITCIDITSDLAKQNNLPEGIYIRQVADFSAAQKAGIQAGDVIISADGTTVKTVDDLNKVKAKHKIGDTIKIVVVRNNVKKTLDLKFIES